MSGSVTVTDARQSGVFWLANDVIDKHGRELGPFGIAAYCALVRHADKAGRCFPSLATLANETGMSKSSMIRSLADIETLGLVEVEHRTDKERGKIANVYTLLGPVAPSVPVTLGICQPDTSLVSDVDMKEYPQEGLTTKTPPNGGGALPARVGDPSDMTAKVEAATGRTFEPDPVTAAIVAGAGDLVTDTKPKAGALPTAKRVDPWAPFKERWRLSLNLPPAKATWQYAQKSVSVAKANGLTPDTAPDAWGRFESDAKAANEWRFVTRQTADERFARWLGQENAAAAVAYDASGWEVRR